MYTYIYVQKVFQGSLSRKISMLLFQKSFSGQFIKKDQYVIISKII